MTLSRLNKVLAEAGIASRRTCEEWIFEGRIGMNGQVVIKPQTLVDIDVDQLTLNGKPIQLKVSKVYYLLNKPLGYLCSNKRKFPKEKLVIDLFHSITQRVFTVGRLDKDTRGLILVTNDGNFSQKVIHPSFNVDKEYLVRTNQEITHEHLIKLSEGAVIEDTFVKPLSVKKVRNGTFKIIVAEGKKREVRLLAAHAGLDVEELTRIRIGSLVLGNLPIGLWRPMTEKEKNQFLKKESRPKSKKKEIEG